jgi:hypothetical protein
MAKSAISYLAFRIQTRFKTMILRIAKGCSEIQIKPLGFQIMARNSTF